MTQVANFTGVARINDGEGVDAGLQVTAHSREVNVLGPVRKPDSRWTYIDQAGHFHGFSSSKDAPYPTLERWEKRMDCPCDPEDYEDEDGCGYSVTAYRCRICAEEIEPGSQLETPSPVRVYEGTTWEVVVEQVYEGTTWEVVVEQLVLPPGGVFLTSATPHEVTVRIAAADTVFFGVARAVETTLASGGRGRTTLVGVSELGRMQQR